MSYCQSWGIKGKRVDENQSCCQKQMDFIKINWVLLEHSVFIQNKVIPKLSISFLLISFTCKSPPGLDHLDRYFCLSIDPPPSCWNLSSILFVVHRKQKARSHLILCFSFSDCLGLLICMATLLHTHSPGVGNMHVGQFHRVSKLYQS